MILALLVALGTWHMAHYSESVKMEAAAVSGRRNISYCPFVFCILGP